MPKLRTYYEILDVAIDADEAAIRRAYRKAAATHHPDRDNYSERSQKRIRELNTARETLLDEKRRAKYDKQLKKMGIIPDDPVEEIEPVKETGSSDSDLTNSATPPETHWRSQDQPTSTGSSTEFEEYNPTPEPQNWDTASDFSSHQSFDNHAFKTKTGTFVKKPIRRKRTKLGKSLLLLVSLPLGGISGISVAILILWLGFQMDPLGLFDTRVTVQNADIKEVLELEPEQEETREPVESIPKLPKSELVEQPDDQRESPSQLSTDDSKSNVTTENNSTKRELEIERIERTVKTIKDLGTAHDVAFSPTGKVIASGGSPGHIKIWDVKSETLKLIYKGHKGRALSIAFSPSGESIVSGGECYKGSSRDTRALKIWDSKTGKEQLSLDGHSGRVFSVAFSPDGNSVVSGSMDNTAKIWDAKTGKEKLTFKGHVGNVHSVAFSPNGNSVASGGADNTIKIWDTQSGTEKLNLTGHTGAVGSVAFAQNGKIIVSASNDGTIKVWDTQTGTEKLTLHGHSSAVSCVAFSPNGSNIVSGDRRGMIKIWDANTLKEKLTFKGHRVAVNGVAFSPDGNRIVSGGTDRTVKIWKLKAADQLDSERKDASAMKEDSIAEALSEGNFKKALILDPNNARAIGMKKAFDISNALADGDFQKALLLEPGNLKAREMMKESTRRKIENSVVTIKELPFGYANVALSPDGRTIACAGEKNTVRLLDAKTGRVRRILNGHAGGVTSVAFSSAGTTFASGSKDRTLIIWDARTGRTKGRINVGHDFCNIAFSPDGKSIALAGSHTVSVLNAKTGRKIDLSKQGGTGNYNVAWNPDGNSLIFSNTQQTLRIWDIEKGVERPSPNGFSGLSVAFSPDRKSIVAASPENKLEIWDTETGEKRQILTGHTKTVFCIAFSPDGKRIVSAGDDQIVRIWDLNTGLEDIALNGHKGRITSIAFSPDGNSVVSGSRDYTIKIWNLKVAEQLDSERKNAPVEDPSSASKPDPKPIKSLPKSFNSATAERFQKAWADKLNLPVKTKNSIGMEFVLIPPGSFSLNDLKPWKKNAPTSQGEFFRGMESSINQPFYISTTEVTQSAYESLVRQNPSKQKGRDLPVEQV